MLHDEEHRQMTMELRTCMGPGSRQLLRRKSLFAMQFQIIEHCRVVRTQEDIYIHSQEQNAKCIHSCLFACLFSANFVLYCSGSCEEGIVILMRICLFPHQLKNQQCHRDMLIGQTDLGNSSLRLTSKMILGCDKLRMKTDQHSM